MRIWDIFEMPIKLISIGFLFQFIIIWTDKPFIKGLFIFGLVILYAAMFIIFGINAVKYFR